jgi:hypothetical protein
MQSTPAAITINPFSKDRICVQYAGIDDRKYDVRFGLLAIQQDISASTGYNLRLPERQDLGRRNSKKD